ncbi:5-oxoprolinase subunit PxpB [Halobacillus litoralis]|uniref:5-oxoprolinase subunit PxpB n=1 Tax=Halobacillus litoralis TaxID=45668 RepID=UPI001CFEA165|nr:5-oxoprolinase subunit PxpB [Halobacillus litoralis]
MELNFHPLGDQSVLIELGTTISEETNQQVRTISALLDEQQPDWIIEYIPAFTSVTVLYDPIYITKHQSPLNRDQLPYDWVCEKIQTLLSKTTESVNHQPRTIDIPVCYGHTYGPDLTNVAEQNGLTEEEVIETHMSGDYLVYMIGFAPGFPYIGGMDEKISTPRRSEPRLSIPAGSVGIAGGQTGVYPIETPGGWQLIGRTPLTLFDPSKETPSLLQSGDHIRFTRITEEEYGRLKEADK